MVESIPWHRMAAPCHGRGEAAREAYKKFKEVTYD